VNQDRFDIFESKNALLLVMADGMGGHKGGEIASDVACRAAGQVFNKTKFPVTDTPSFLKQVVVQCQSEIIKAGIDHAPEIEPKTTLVLCLIQNAEIIWSHVGDSRLYVIRDDVIVEQTVDHSSVERLFQLGQITEKEKKTHPSRHMVTQCMGSRSKPPRPSISNMISLQAHDVLLLCSDGLWGQLQPQDIKLGFNQTDMDQCLDVLAGKAETNGYPKSDNISAIALRWISDKDVRVDDFCENELQDLIDSVEDINRAVNEIQKQG
jgi:serine/threonine protein phosphatase PrpC